MGCVFVDDIVKYVWVLIIFVEDVHKIQLLLLCEPHCAHGKWLFSRFLPAFLWKCHFPLSIPGQVPLWLYLTCSCRLLSAPVWYFLLLISYTHAVPSSNSQTLQKPPGPPQHSPTPAPALHMARVLGGGFCSFGYLSHKVGSVLFFYAGSEWETVITPTSFTDVASDCFTEGLLCKSSRQGWPNYGDIKQPNSWYVGYVLASL